jgi:hypothetical protein
VSPRRRWAGRIRTADELRSLSRRDAEARLRAAEAMREMRKGSSLRAAAARKHTTPLVVRNLGYELSVIKGATNMGRLLEKLRDRDSSARAELAASSLLLPEPNAEVEFEPRVAVGHRERKPDFRTRIPGAPWTYVEVTQPDRSAAHMRVDDALEQFSPILDDVTGTYAVEVFFWRQPNDEELRIVRSEVAQVAHQLGEREHALPAGLGTIYVNTAEPGRVVTDDHDRPHVPRLGRADVRDESGVTMRSIAVRMPYADGRSANVLAAEARHLPHAAPGLIMVHTAGAAGSMRSWPTIVEEELALGLYEQISAVCLFRMGAVVADAGMRRGVWLHLIHNQGANHNLPTWLTRQLSRFPPPNV